MRPATNALTGVRRPRLWAQHALTAAMLAPALVYLLVFFAYPLLVTFLTSITAANGTDYTLAEYSAVFTTPSYLASLQLTFVLALGTTILSILLAVPIALVLRRRPRGHHLMRLLILTPLMVLALISALGLLIIWGKNGWLNILVSHLIPGSGPLKIDFTLQGLLLFYTWLYAPYTVLTTLSAIEGLDPNVEEAARVSGASAWQVFRTVTLPLSWPGIRAGSLLTFLLAFGAFNVPLVAGGDLRPLAVVIYTEAETFQNFARGSSLAIVMAVISLGVMLVYQRFAGTSAGRRI